MRWLIVVGIAVGGFALVWWVGEEWFGLDRSTAVTIATAAGSLLATPFIRWAGEEIRPTAPPNTSPVDSATSSSGSGWRVPVGVLAAVAALLVCQGLAQTILPHGNGRSGNDPGTEPADARPGASVQTVDVNKTAWHAGYALTFGRATYDQAQNPPLTVVALAENQGDRNVTFELSATFSIGDQHVSGYNRGSPIIPGRQKTEVVFEFSVDLADRSLAEGILTFGDARVARTVVPLGGGTGLVAHEPRQVLGPMAFTHRDISFEISSCQVRGDIATEHKQAPSGQAVIACRVSATYDGVPSFHTIDEDNFRIRLPDGTAVGPAEYPIMNLNRGVLNADLYVAFFVKEPVAGAYTLQLIDVHTSERESPENVRDVPITT
jgi:hypothetical protein